MGIIETLGVKYYLFDFDGTLADSMKYFVEAMIEVLDRRGAKYGDDVIDKCAPLSRGEMGKYFVSLGAKGTPEEVVEEIWETTGVLYKNVITPKKGVTEKLRFLKSKGVSLNVLSATRKELLDRCLERNNISCLFDNIWSSECFGLQKNDPELYVKVASVFGVKPRDLALFDDNVNALAAAKEAGLKTVGVYDYYSRDSEEKIKKISDAYVYSFDEL